MIDMEYYKFDKFINDIKTQPGYSDAVKKYGKDAVDQITLPFAIHVFNSFVKTCQKNVMRFKKNALNPSKRGVRKEFVEQEIKKVEKKEFVEIPLKKEEIFNLIKLPQGGIKHEHILKGYEVSTSRLVIAGNEYHKLNEYLRQIPQGKEKEGRMKKDKRERYYIHFSLIRKCKPKDMVILHIKGEEMVLYKK